MQHAFFDAWSRIDSPIRRAPAGLKLGLAFAAIVTVVTVPLRFGWVFAGIGITIGVVALVSRVPLAALLRRILLFELFVAIAVLLSFFQPRGAAIALSILIRSTLSVATMVLLTATTPFADLLRVMQRVRVPALLVTVLALMYRYLFLLADEAGRMQRAQRGRTFTQGRVRAWTAMAALAGQLFVRSTERAERIYAAMCARGWR